MPERDKLYSPLFGEVEFQNVTDGIIFPITVSKDGDTYNFTLEGRTFIKREGKCLLFPSKYEQDWSKFKVKKNKFDPNTLQPFDKVLVRDGKVEGWMCDIYSHKLKDNNSYMCISNEYYCCIPYNEETKHLVGTMDEAPEYYKYWEG